MAGPLSSALVGFVKLKLLHNFKKYQKEEQQKKRGWKKVEMQVELMSANGSYYKQQAKF